MIDRNRVGCDCGMAFLGAELALGGVGSTRKLLPYSKMHRMEPRPNLSEKGVLHVMRIQALKQWLSRVLQVVTPMMLDYDDVSNTYPIRHPLRHTHTSRTHTRTT
jgi:hypothetical protein